MAAESDNLDARMEAIRLKNEELEKKHKEIMEDERNAKLENAVVNLKASDIPKHHPYDNIELDFDVKDTEKELAKNPDTAPKSRLSHSRPITSFYLHLKISHVFFLFSICADRRPMPRKEFLDEIPPDPVNFLREDGDEATPRPEPIQRQQSNKNPRNNRNRPERQRSNNESVGGDSNSGDSPPRPRNQNQRPRQQQQQQRSPPQEGNSPRKPPQQLRSERRSAPPQSDEISTGHSQQQQPNRQRRPNNRPPNKESGDIKNITVQVTDGEVRSVKCKRGNRAFH